MSDTEVAEATTEIPLPGLPGEIRLPSGGWAQLKPVSELTGRDVRRIRTALNADGTGDTMSQAMALTLGAIVVEWQIPGQSMLQLPYANPAVLDRLSFDDLMALEEIAEPIMKRALGHRDKKAGESDPS
jgi:hypothetical protein